MQKPNLLRDKQFIQKLIRKANSIFKGLQKVNTNFWVYSPVSLPVQHTSIAKPINEALMRFQIQRVEHKTGIHNPTVWVVCPSACDIALKMKKNKLVYLRTDIYELFPNVPSKIIRDYDRKLKANADLTLFVSSALFHEESKQCKKALYLDHGVDYEMFASADNSMKTPPDISNIKRPIVGYFGSIDSHTVDYESIDKLVDLLPEMSFVFVGDVCDNPSFVSKKNVWMLGQKAYEQIPYYGSKFDVAIMPWRQTHWIQVCNPIKLKEYLALGKPVVSTPFKELEKYADVVYIARTTEDFADFIRRALFENNPERVAARQKRIRTATWGSKAELVREELRN